MNHVEDRTASVETEGTENGGTARRRPIRRLLAGMLMTVVAAAGLSFMATPAEAATSVSYCFVTTNGAPLDREVTRLLAWHNGYWHVVGYSRTGTSGCDTLDTRQWARYPLKVAAGTFTSKLRGETPYYAYAGYFHANLGTGVAWLPW